MTIRLIVASTVTLALAACGWGQNASEPMPTPPTSTLGSVPEVLVVDPTEPYVGDCTEEQLRSVGFKDAVDNYGLENVSIVCKDGNVALTVKAGGNLSNP